jgi:glycosyltransferase involved in cell wall biosynthesis
MHVVMIVRNSFTHDARVTREARTLSEAGMRVTVVAVRGQGELPEREVIDGFTVERLDVTGRVYAVLRALLHRGGAGQTVGSSKPVSDRPVRFARDLVVMAARTFSTARFNLVAARRAVMLKADVYHCHDFNTLYAGVTAAGRAPGPIIYDSHELYAHLNVAHPTRVRRAVVEFLERRWIRKAAGVITVSDAFADQLVRRYGIPRPIVVLNVPDATRETTVDVPEALKGPGVKLLYVGGIQRARGLEQAIRALAELPRARLVLMGPAFPDEESSLRALAESLGLFDRVAFVPPVPHGAVVSVAKHATLALVPFQDVGLSHRLTIPNKLFEAIHAGLPVVASDFPEIRRVVEENDIGVVCDAGDPHAIAAAVNSLISDPERLKTLHENAIEAAKRFTWPQEAAKLLALYRGIH